MAEPRDFVPSWEQLIPTLINKTTRKQRSINLPYHALRKHDAKLARNFLTNPEEHLNIARYIIKMERNKQPEDDDQLTNLRITNPPAHIKENPRDLRATHIGKYITIEGLVKQVTEVRPTAQYAHFQCKYCGEVQNLEQDDDFILEPPNGKCESSPIGSHRWLFHEEHSEFIDFQKIELQEKPENLKGGAQPERITVHITDDMVHQINPGDRVKIHGILKTGYRRQGQQKRTDFNKILHLNHYDMQQQDFEEIELTPQDIKDIQQLAKNKDIYTTLRNSFAPTIYGYETIKDALILTLFGGVTKERPDGSRNRGDAHILLVGDPGTSKSQLVSFITKLAPRGIYTSGKSTSSAGLVGAAVRNEFGDGNWTIEAGAAVLADKGHLGIDELDKMTKEDQSSMHQVMEQQEITITKAGISATMKARCSVVGAANPKLGRFDEFEPLHNQINMPPALLSRFDLIFSMRDKPNEEFDSKLARHIIKTHRAGEVRNHRKLHKDKTYTQQKENELNEMIQPEIPSELFRKYIAYAKKNIMPVLSQAAEDRIHDYYVELRNKNKDSGIPLTARQLEAFIRLAEANARLRLSEEVTKDDADKAIGIVEEYLKSVGIDQETGSFDIDVIATGVSHSKHDRYRLIQQIIRSLCDSNNVKYVSGKEVLEEAQKHGLSASQIEKTLQELKRAGDLFSPGGDDTYASP